MMGPSDKLRYFDPSDADAAMQLAYAALDLLESACTMEDIHHRSQTNLRGAMRRVASSLNLGRHSKVLADESEFRVMWRILSESKEELP